MFDTYRRRLASVTLANRILPLHGLEFDGLSEQQKAVLLSAIFDFKEKNLDDAAIIYMFQKLSEKHGNLIQALEFFTFLTSNR